MTETEVASLKAERMREEADQSKQEETWLKWAEDKRRR